MEFIKEETAKAITHVAVMFDHRKGWFNVDDTIDHNKGRPRGYY